jgi:PIN domain nuclease of toxin-antitoxin system
LRRTIEAKSKGASDQQASLHQKQQMSVFNADLKVKSQKQAFEMKEAHRNKKLNGQRSRYAHVSNAMGQNSPFQHSVHSNITGRAATLQNGGTSPNTRVTTTAHVSKVRIDTSYDYYCSVKPSMHLTFLVLLLKGLWWSAGTRLCCISSCPADPDTTVVPAASRGGRSRQTRQETTGADD